ncbi:MAG: phospholipase D-like domain-containing protein [Elusimicrobia bacterium]|nr:phospholipase D-like domain-containing protein [Elusimicrobiota bacterium]
MEEKSGWEKYCFRQTGSISGNSVRLLKNGEEAFGEMIEAVKAAKEYLLLEFYAFADDAAGRLFAALLKEKMRQGVRVYLIRDGVGSILTDQDFFSGLAAEGAGVAEFRPWVHWKPYWNWIKRDHRKILCMDGAAAFVGGFNITEADLPRSLGGRGWKDAQVRVEGPAVAEIEKLFWESWSSSRQTAALSGEPERSGGAATEPGGKEGVCPPPVWRHSKEHLAGNPAACLRTGAVSGDTQTGSRGNVPVSIVSASGIRNFMSIRRSYRYAIDMAEDYIYITNAYFLPDRLIYRRLIRAVRRGVDVRIIAPLKTDHPYVRWASWAMYAHMLKNGIRLYEWQGEILHSKIAVIDGLWSSVGSHNLDHRSLHYNLELNVNVFNRKFGSEVRRLFMEDIKGSKELTLSIVRSRPLLSKAASKLLYLFRSFG